MNALVAAARTTGSSNNAFTLTNISLTALNNSPLNDRFAEKRRTGRCRTRLYAFPAADIGFKTVASVSNEPRAAFCAWPFEATLPTKIRLFHYLLSFVSLSTPLVQNG